MKKSCLLLMMIILTLLAMPVKAVNTQNFYFEDFTGDYYLTKDAEGISHLRVVENVTAVFPDYKQNKGICRQIAYTNQGGKNVTLSNLTRENLKLTRNGVTEPIYSIERENNYYNVCTGTEEYLMGKQVYKFEYEFAKVVTEFEENGKEYQELYWDTNGNGSRQRFDKVTARVHFDNMGWYTGESWCYVGKYGESGQDRCKISKIEDGVEFTASDLGAFENLTFDTELAAGSFVVPEPEKNYAYVKILTLVGAGCLAWLVFAMAKYWKVREKEKYYKGMFVKPEYQPHAEYDLPEMAEVYLGKKKDVKVAMLLKMIVERKVELVKTDGDKWQLNVKKEVDGAYKDLLKILNNGLEPRIGGVIEIKRRTASSDLVTIRRVMEKKILGKLKEDELVEEKYSLGSSEAAGATKVITRTITALIVMMVVGLMIIGYSDDGLQIFDMTYGVLVFEKGFWPTMLVMVVGTVTIWAIFSSVTKKYKNLTFKGLEAARYMDGLKMYIEMAEAERLKMLQSVKGADISAAGIVKLYEKLLPYAAVFGLEESWMEEMKEYCRVEEVPEPDYLMTGILASDISRSLHTAATYATTSTVMSSSGGGSSSGFSGGGGGGFSGGGGGGGGFGGR